MRIKYTSIPAAIVALVCLSNLMLGQTVVNSGNGQIATSNDYYFDADGIISPGTIYLRTSADRSKAVKLSVKEVQELVDKKSDQLYSYRRHLYGGGIKAEKIDPNSDGYVRLSVRVVDPIITSDDISRDAENEIYSIRVNATTTSYGQSNYVTTYVKSDQIRYLLDKIHFYQVNGASRRGTNYQHRHTQHGTSSCNQINVAYDYWQKLGDSRPFNTSTETYDELQSVILYMEVRNMKVKSVKIPGIGEFFPAQYFAPNGSAASTRFEILVNGNESTKVSLTSDQTTIPVVNAELGDKITFRVTVPNGTNGNTKPVITGMPATWVSAFAGDVLFYTSASVTPGELNPFIGFDSRVHTLMLRNYPPGFQVRQPDWTQSSGFGNTTVYEWSILAQREMDPELTKYSAPYTWPKYETLGDGTKQRHNQKEGLNMQYLNYFAKSEGRSIVNASFRSYDESQGAKYMLGFDDDELAYFNSTFRESSSLPPNGQILKLEDLPWKKMPEGEELYYDQGTGFPTRGWPVNEMITAYRKNRERNLPGGNLAFAQYYQGYEIQENGTNKDNPYTANDNDGTAKHPGLVTLQSGNNGATAQVKFNITSPLKISSTMPIGFYEALVGTNWPSYGEMQSPFTLKGLQGFSDSQLARLSITYTSMDRLGDITNQDRPYNGQRDSDGNWTVYFDIGKPSYGWITAYYASPDGSGKVMIAGKELHDLFLMFSGVNPKIKNEATPCTDCLDLKEGIGHGQNIWLEDYRETQDNFRGFTKPHTFGDRTKFTKPYLREYVIPVGTKVRFETRDGDPFTFNNEDHEWYLSSKSEATRTPEALLDGSRGEAYLKYYITPWDSRDTPIEATAGTKNGRYFTYQFNTAGEYEFKILYRGSSDLIYRIRVVDYGQVTDFTPGTTAAPFPQQATVVKRSLTTDEGNWLGIPPTDYDVYEIKNQYSKYAYVDGPRAGDTEYPNRWARANDYQDHYLWEILLADHQEVLSNYHDDQFSGWRSLYDLNQRQHWFWSDWALHYSSNWQRAPSFGFVENVIQGIPKYTASDKVTRLKDGYILSYLGLNSHIQDLFTSSNSRNSNKMTWQYTIPLVSYTDNDGYRCRSNPSCIYDLPETFNNDHGAFTGTVLNPVNPEAIQAPDYGDDYKNMQRFYYDLSEHKILLVRKDDYDFRNDISIQVWSSYPTIDQVFETKQRLIYGSRLSSITGQTGTDDARIAAVQNNKAEKSVEVSSPYPNPFAQSITIPVQASAAGDIQIQITSITGTVVAVISEYAEEAGTYNFVWNGTDNSQHQVTPGVYIYRVTANGIVTGGKVVKIK